MAQPIPLVVYARAGAPEAAAVRLGEPGWPFRVVPAQAATALEIAHRLAAESDVVLLDAAAVPTEPGWLAALAAAADREPGAGVLGAKVLLPDSQVFGWGRTIVSPFGLRDRYATLGHLEYDKGQFRGTVPADAVVAGLVYVRREALARPGAPGPAYTDLQTALDDLCMSARAAGLDVLAVRDIGVTVAVRDLRPEIPDADRRLWLQSWRWDPAWPDLHAVRAAWGDTAVCWRVGPVLRDDWGVPEPLVDLQIVTWNNLRLLRPCLASLRRTRYPRMRLTVLDNGSTDGTSEYLADLAGGDWPFEVATVRTPVNIGHAPGVNWLFALCDAPLVAVLDDDILLPPDWLARLVATLRAHPYAGVVGPRLLEPDRRHIQFADMRFSPHHDCRQGHADDGRFDYVAVGSHVKGCCMVYRRRAIDRAGPFDIRYAPSQWDDPDHHVHVRFAGYDVLYDGRVGVTHFAASGTRLSPAALASSNANASKLAAKWGRDVFALLDEGLDRLGDRRILALPDPAARYPTVLWEGPFAGPGAVAACNRTLCAALVAEPGLDLALVAETQPEGPLGWHAGVQQAACPTVHVRHQAAVDPTPPTDGAWVVMLTGSTAEGLEAVADLADEVWATTPAAYGAALAAGVAPDRARQVAPEDLTMFVRDRLADLSRRVPARAADTFRPGVEPIAIPGRRGRVFLHLPRWESPDLSEVLGSYHRAFAAGDDVCLVLWADPAQGLSGEEAASRIQATLEAAGCDPEAGPDLILVADELDGDGQARLFAAADWLVRPADALEASRARRVGTGILAQPTAEAFRALLKSA